MIADIVLCVMIAGLIAYTVFAKGKHTTLAELSEVKRWHVKGYITAEDVAKAVGQDGNMTVKSYNILKNKVDRMRTIRTLTDEKSAKPKVSSKTQVVRMEGGAKDEGSEMETANP